MVLPQFIKTRIYEYLIISEILITYLKQIDRYLYFPISFFNPNLGGVSKGFVLRQWQWGRGGETTLSPVLNSLELRQKLQIWHVSICTYVVSENIPFDTKLLLISLMSTCFCKRLAGKNSTFTQSNSVRVMLEVFQFCFQFL